MKNSSKITETVSKALLWIIILFFITGSLRIQEQSKIVDTKPISNSSSAWGAPGFYY